MTTEHPKAVIRLSRSEGRYESNFTVHQVAANDRMNFEACIREMIREADGLIQILR